jgi:hypothetical protein
MTLTDQPAVHRRSARMSGLWPLVVLAALALVGGAVIVVDGLREAPSTASTLGSGGSVTERREAAPFATVELAGTNAVVIHVGPSRSVEVTGDDNLVGRVTTIVRDGRLVIDDTGSFTTRAPMNVAVSTPSLDGVALSGDGTVTVDGVSGADFRAELVGAGTLVVSGTTRHLAAVLAGDGTIDLHGLSATDGTARLEGTGTIRVSATATLDATLSGTGTILYRGDPSVTMHDTGTGAIVPE